MSVQSDRVASPTAEELFDSLVLDDTKPKGDENKRPPPKNGPPRPPLNHRPTRSQEEAMRARRMQSSGPRPGGPSQSPHKRAERRPRRNSDSSLLIDIEKPLTEEEKKQRDARRREKEGKHRQQRPNKRVDVIDQLDATSIFGIGAFHHDGPFDACNPHRNRKGSRRAPMNAFAKDSANNSIGGSGPLRSRPDHSTFLGTGGQEAFTDYAQGARKNNPKMVRGPHGELLFDPTSRGDILHGDESLGLGTSTFLEGTPAARTVIQKREAEQAAETADGGLQRKKSLAQRIRGINKVPREYGPGGRPSLAEGGRRPTYPDLPRRTTDGEAGSRQTHSDEYSNEPELISVAKPGDSDEPKSPTSPKPRPRRVSIGLERRSTADGTTSADKPGSGLLARVKSLKGGRRTRPQPDIPAPPPVVATAPGTAV